MEPVNGLQLLKFVRAEPGFSRVRFILACPRRNRAAAVGAGADGVLVEPSSPEMIRKTLLEVLQPNSIADRERATTRTRP
jgi:hypothetical protein